MKLLFVLFVFFLSFEVSANQKIEKLIEKSRVKKSEFSIYVTSDKSKKDIYSLNADTLRVPASLTKLITGAAVLEKMPPAHKFETKLQSLESAKDGVLNGSLYLVGEGDPGFVSESMWNLVNNFVRTGITEITGDIVVDDSKFDQVRFDASRDAGSQDRAYDSPIGAMTFNWSAVNIYVRPVDKVGEPAKIFLDPQNDYFHLVNKTKTTSGNGKSINVRLVPSTQKGKVEDLIVTGTIGKKRDEIVIFRAIDKPEVWAGENLKSFLQRRGIKVKGSVRSGKAMAGQLVTLASIKSATVGKHVDDMLKYSNNYIAEILAKNLAAEYVGKPAKMEDGIQVLRDYLKQIGLKDFKLINPSGLSRSNDFTAKHFHQILEHMRARAVQNPEFFSGLAIAGVDGTLKSRMKELSNSGRVRAKTGMLNGVSGLAGYITNKDETLTFSMIYNGANDKNYDARRLMDAIILSLVD